MSNRPMPITDANTCYWTDEFGDTFEVVRTIVAQDLERQLADSISQRDAAEKIAGQVDGLKRRIAELNYRLDRSCVWTEDEDGNWDTGCGGCFSFVIGGKRAVYCCHCGGKIISKEYRFEQQEE